MHPIYRGIMLIGAAAVASLVTLAPTASATPVAHASATPKHVSQSHVVTSRKATAADIAQGVAAAATVNTCVDETGLDNPYTGGYTTLLTGALAWQESTDANGHPMARMNNTTSIVFKNKANAGTTKIFFKGATWNSSTAGTYGIAQAHYARTGVPDLDAANLVSGGHQLGIKITTAGNVDEYNPPGTWLDHYHVQWGFRQWLTNNNTVSPVVVPRLYMSLQREDNGAQTDEEIRIHATGACGSAVLY